MHDAHADHALDPLKLDWIAMNIVIADDYQRCMKQLDCFHLLDGHDVTIYETPAATREELVQRLSHADVLVAVRERVSVDEELLSALPRLKQVALVGRHSRFIDAAACTRHGVAVTHGVFASPIAPAELTVALILASRRNVVLESTRMKRGEWPATFSYRLDGSTLGIYGLGVVGSRVARAAEGLGMKVLVWGGDGSRERASSAGYEFARSKEDLFTRSDVLSVHLRFSARSAGAVTLADLQLMKPSALFVNTARAELVQSGALEQALEGGRPGFAAVDVYEHEPILNGDHPLLRMDNVVCMPHLGWADRETFELYFGEAFEQVRLFAKGGEMRLTNPEVVMKR